MKRVLLFSVVAFALLGSIAGVGAQSTGTANTTTAIAPPSSSSETSATNVTATANATSTNATATGIDRSRVQFTFDNQTTNGTAVEVGSVFLPDGGFLVIHDQHFSQNGLGSVIGVSQYVPANRTFQTVQIRLFDAPGQSFGQDRLRRSRTLYAQAVHDTDANRRYDGLRTNGAADVGYLAASGRQAVRRARVTLDQGSFGGVIDTDGEARRPASTASTRASTQATTSLTISSAEISARAQGETTTSSEAAPIGLSGSNTSFDLSNVFSTAFSNYGIIIVIVGVLGGVFVYRRQQ